MHQIFEYMRSNNLTLRGRLNLQAIEKLTATKIIDLAELIVTMTETNQIEKAPTTFTHSAAKALGGSRGVCEGLDHRLDAVKELARFAIMYSDKVFIENFFSNYTHLQHYRDDEELREALWDDLSVLLALKPLIENKHIEFFTPHEHWCQDCLTSTFGADTKRKIERGRKRLREMYINNTSAALVHFDDDLCEIEWSAPKPYLEHEMVTSNRAKFRRLHEILASMPTVLRKIEHGEAVTLSRSLQKKLGLHDSCVGTIADSVTYGIASSKILNTSFLTNSSLDLAFLSSISGDQMKEDRNSIALNHLTSLVPFVADVSISDLIKIRGREQEAFIKYRRALNEAIDEFRSERTFGNKEARALYSDVIAPQLTALDQSVRLAKRDLGKTAYRSVIAVTGAISFGIYTGFIPTEMAEMAKVLGFTKVAIDILEKLLPLGDASESIKGEDLYFLWRVKKLKA